VSLVTEQHSMCQSSGGPIGTTSYAVLLHRIAGTASGFCLRPEPCRRFHLCEPGPLQHLAESPPLM
jgi:hypothetical protein